MNNIKKNYYYQIAKHETIKNPGHDILLPMMGK